MGRTQQIDHHADGALEELDLARKASSEAVAHAHLEPSELHVRRMRVLSGTPRPALQLADQDRGLRKNTG
jgi:hypothetical protein